jgi:hypothetical protein
VKQFGKIGANGSVKLIDEVEVFRLLFPDLPFLFLFRLPQFFGFLL